MQQYVKRMIDEPSRVCLKNASLDWISNANVIHHINRVKEKKLYDDFHRFKESTWQTSALICNKNSQQSKNSRTFLKLIKSIYKICIVRIMINSEKLNCLLLEIGSKARMPTLPLVFSIVLVDLAIAIGKKKK